VTVAPDMGEARRRETLVDTFASLALEGMRPSPRDIEDGLAYIEGRVTLEQIIDGVLEPYRRGAAG